MVRRKGSLGWLIVMIVSTVVFVSCTSANAVVRMDDNYRVFYEIFIASFYDSDGDGIGDLKGILQKFDYLNSNGKKPSLEIGGIWLMPLMSSPSYHKYDVTDYYQVDPVYGTMDDFVALADRCHQQNVKLIIDLPINHTSDQHPWFQSAVSGDPIYRNYYHFRSDFASGYHQTGPSDYYEGRFTSSMPDLNLDNVQLREEILKICKFWLDAGADGFRLDAVAWFFSGNTAKNVEFLQWLNDELRAYDHDVYLVGEAWSDGQTILDLYQSGIPSLFNFPFSQSTGLLITSVRSGKGAELSASLGRWYEQLPESAIDAPFLTNHDHARSAGALMGDVNLQKMAAAVYLLLPGNPFMYYGEEIGMTGSGRDENKRLPMLWSLTDPAGMANLPREADQAQRLKEGVDRQAQDPGSLLAFYRHILALRRAHPALTSGHLEALDLGHEALLAYRATAGEESALVIQNLSDESVTLPISWPETGFAPWDTGFGLPTITQDSLTLPPHSGCVWD